MGGVSRSRYAATPEGHALFSGVVALENNGGFASVRAPMSMIPPTLDTQLGLRVTGDGKRYQLRLRTDTRLDGVTYSASFDTCANAITEVRLSANDFAPTFRGRQLSGVPPLTWWDVAQVGFMISERQSGHFSLKVLLVHWLTDHCGQGDGQH